MSFRVDNLDSLSMLHPQASKDLLAQVQMFEPGMGLFEEPGRSVRVFRSDLTEYETYCDSVRETLKNRPIAKRKLTFAPRSVIDSDYHSTKRRWVECATR